jgi:CBS domain-containing protein
VATVADAMSRGLVRAEPEVSLEEAARLMASRRVGSVLVFDGERLIGILTERDVLRAVAEGRVTDVRVRDCMTAHPETIAPDEPIERAAAIMLHGGFRHLPVTEGLDVVGMLSMRDLVAGAIGDAAPKGV